MSFWDTAKDVGAFALGGPVGYFGKKLVEGKFGNPLDWGKKQADPANAQLASGQYMRDYLQTRLGQPGRTAPQAQAAQINMRPQGQVRGMEIGLAQDLQRVSTGQQMGAAEMAIQRGMRQAAAQQQAQAAMARGGMAGVAQRAAARNLSNLGIDAAGQGAAARLQDQGAARQMLAGVLGQTRGADIGLATQQAGLNQQTSLANQDAILRQQGMDDQARLAYLAQLHGVDVAEMQARLAQEAANMGQTGIFPDLLKAGAAIGTAVV